MKLLSLIKNYTVITLLNFYLSINILGFDKGSLGSMQLFAVFIICFFSLFWHMLTKRIVIKISLIFLVVFSIYFILRILIDTDDSSTLFSYTLGTTGGIFLFYVLGFLVRISVRDIFAIAYLSKSIIIKLFILFSTGYLLINTLIFANVYSELSNNLRNDIFLISNIQGLYQRPGNFMIIASLITSLILFLIQLTLSVRSQFYRRWMYLFLVIYSVNVLIILLSALSIGSNAGVVVVFSLWFATVITVLVLIQSGKNLMYVIEVNLTIRKWFSFKSLKRISYALILTLLSVRLMIWILTEHLNIDIEKTRIYNFGSGGFNTSLESRIEILINNFFIHWMYSPIFGNMDVDARTTGVGSYAHSLLAYLLTHTGLIGFTMFFTYVFFAIKELILSSTSSRESENYRLSVSSLKLYSFVVLGILFVYASIAVTVTWSPLWFAMGLLLPPVVFVPKTGGI
ncbi:hypothetical protein PN456_19850 [Nodularia spumigena CS-586/05]|uniref:hypothetical protein n=1 Tax=Nodularia spumigena TaxID=70799 RepID=UPI00232D48F0|nr:hypothetical protein [Nodularia spumigena]MDB9342432.1 hypothetical protein [Nodularia spumigena CS-588/06]MDB9371170.1 hypothetical protein [Nodularia spumigena CS-586/05]